VKKGNVSGIEGGMGSVGNEVPIIIVSGLPRSGTSMMMQMCEAGGLEPLSDYQRQADEDNLKGYYELEQVKKLEKDKSWLPDAKGKVVKVISALLKHLPLEYTYKVIFMHRNMEEIIASQKQMLERRREPQRFTDEDLARMFRNHLRQVDQWLGDQQNFEVLHVDYNELLDKPREKIAEIKEFLGNGINDAAMTAVVDKSQYRQRKNLKNER
jgi:hypothetical protein